METSNYILVIAASIATFIGFLLPFIIAAIIGRKVPRRKLFVFVCGVFSYGLGGLVVIVLGPVEVLATFLAPQLLHVNEHSTIGAFLQGAGEIIEVIALVLGIVFIFLVPLYARKGLWHRVCEALANE